MKDLDGLKSIYEIYGCNFHNFLNEHNNLILGSFNFMYFNHPMCFLLNFLNFLLKYTI